MASSFSSFIELLLSVFRFLSDLFARKNDEKAELRRLIDEKQAELDKAVDDGRITDIQMLREQLDMLRKRYEGKGGVTPPVVCVLLAIGVVCSGCSHFSGGKGQDHIVVVGERVMTVEPGQTVPALVPPAKKWYLVDSEAMKSWLNVSWTLDRKDGGSE
jgi:hypothetical protein